MTNSPEQEDRLEQDAADYASQQERDEARRMFCVAKATEIVAGRRDSRYWHDDDVMRLVDKFEEFVSGVARGRRLTDGDVVTVQGGLFILERGALLPYDPSTDTWLPRESLKDAAKNTSTIVG